MDGRAAGSNASTASTHPLKPAAGRAVRWRCLSSPCLDSSFATPSRFDLRSSGRLPRGWATSRETYRAIRLEVGAAKLPLGTEDETTIMLPG
jgi:hypothetical protein